MLALVLRCGFGDRHLAEEERLRWLLYFNYVVTDHILTVPWVDLRSVIT